MRFAPLSKIQAINNVIGMEQLTEPALVVMLCSVAAESGDPNETPDLLSLLLSDEVTLATANSKRD